MIYFLLSEDTQLKDKKIDEIKKKYLPSKEALQFDFIIIHGIKLDPAELKKALIQLPSVSENKVVVIRSVEKLSAQNKDIVLNFIDTKYDAIILVLDSNSPDLDNAFTKKISKQAEVLRLKSNVKSNVFDMTNAIGFNNPKKALKLLFELISNGDHPLQIMGALVWFWGKKRSKVSKENFKKGLLVLQEADLNIKRSRLNPEIAVEIAVVKLCSLLAC
ncbi:MAG: hypothetical protein P9X22_02815 [Candidatus Zapsychrus exili]|nr:hypothetical protein [Candidatus Zapsychrus exili]